MKVYSKVFLVLSLVFNMAALTAQEEFAHYYLQIDGSKSECFELEMGIIEFDEDYKPKRKNIAEIESLEQLNEAIRKSLGEENTSEQLNIVIHGINGHYKFAWNDMVQNLSTHLYNNDDSKKKVIFSIIWDSSLNYFKGAKIARKKGDFLGPFIKKLITEQRKETKINFLCHSMGNRIFQYMMVESNLLEEENKVIDQYISVGADVEAEIFYEDQPLHNIGNIVNDITIYMHNNDRSLKLSKLVNKSTRLGLQGVNLNMLPSNFRVIDVSTITDQDKIKSILTNHLYFYLSPNVMNDINRIMWNKDFHTNKKELDHPRRLKLMP